MSADAITEKINDWNKNHKIVIYSKTTCGFCSRAKQLLSSEYPTEWSSSSKVIELNQLGAEGRSIQDTLHKMTGQRTVPSVWVGGKHIGGCDETIQAHKNGSLNKLVK